MIAKISQELEVTDLPDLNRIIKDFEHRQMVFSLLGLIILMGISIIANNLHLQAVAQQSTRYVAKMNQHGEFREAKLILAEALAENFETIKFQSKRPGRSLILPASAELLTEPSLWRIFSTDKITVPILNPIEPNSGESIVFVYDRFRLWPYAVAIWLFLIFITIPQTRHVKRRLISQFEKDLAIEKGKALEMVSQKVRHNLRTPLASLMRLPARLPESMAPDRELLKTSINQIRKITAALDSKREMQQGQSGNSDLIYDTLYQIVQQLPHTIPEHIVFNAYIEDSLVSALVPHIPVELQVIIGNIVNNSIDALKSNPGKISVRVRDMAPDLVIEIEDDGPGIAPTVLPHIFENGFTFGKANGSGLGLYHAKNWIKKWSGKIEAASIPFIKTEIKITLPIADRSSWYAPRLKISKSDLVVILEDQLAARQLWKLKLAEYGITNQVRYLISIQEANQFLESHQFERDKTLFLFDYDLQGPNTGLDLLKKMPLSTRRYLVTGHFDRGEIRTACENHGIFLIPKSQIADLPVVVVGS